MLGLLLLTIPVFAGETEEPIADIAAHQMQVTIDPDANLLHVIDQVTLTRAIEGEFEFSLNMNLAISKFLAEGLPVEFETKPFEGSAGGETDYSGTFHVIVANLPVVTDTFTLTYEGIINDPIDPSTALGRVRGDFTSGIVSPDGVYLSSETGWYPDTYHAMPTYEISIFCPDGWSGVTQGDLMWRNDSGESFWISDVPTDGCVLVANEYFLRSRDIEGIVCSTYFYEDNPELSDQFLDKLEEYLPAYIELFGPFPYTRFDVVENFFTTGYGMPGFTLLGSRVLTMPYATAEGSLAHELVHCWWGNYVYPDWDHGNWCEGLTFFSTNYYWNVIQDDEEAAENFRFRDMLRYSIEVGVEDDYPVRQFRTKNTAVDGDIGYSKAGAIFGMLMTMLGEDTFFASLRHIVDVHGGEHATWDDFRDRFEEISGRELDDFFACWLDNTGAPELAIDEILHEETDEGWILAFRVSQTGDPYHFTLPIQVKTETSDAWVTIETGSDPSMTTLLLPEPAVSIELDPEYRVFHRLSREEINSCLNATMEADSLLVVLPSGGEDDTLRIMDYMTMPPSMREISVKELYEELSESISMGDDNVMVMYDNEVNEEDLSSSAILCFGSPRYNSVAASIAADTVSDVLLYEEGFEVAGVEYTSENSAALISVRNPYAVDYDVTFYLGNSPDAIFKASLIFFYGWDSYVVYEAGSPVDRGEWDRGRGPWYVELD